MQKSNHATIAKQKNKTKSEHHWIIHRNQKHNTTGEVRLVVGDDNLHIHTGIDGDVGQLSHHLGRRVEIQNALVDAHLEAIEGVGTLTAGGLADQKSELLGGHSDGAGNFKVLLKSLVLEFGTHSLNSLNVSGSQGDADAVNSIFLYLSSLNMNKKQ